MALGAWLLLFRPLNEEIHATADSQLPSLALDGIATPTIPATGAFLLPDLQTSMSTATSLVATAVLQLTPLSFVGIAVQSFSSTAQLLLPDLDYAGGPIPVPAPIVIAVDTVLPGLRVIHVVIHGAARPIIMRARKKKS